MGIRRLNGRADNRADDPHLVFGPHVAYSALGDLLGRDRASVTGRMLDRKRGRDGC
jgi:hypothetical protein